MYFYKNFRERVGGMKYVKKNFIANFDVVVQDGHIAELLVDITMHIAA